MHSCSVYDRQPCSQCSDTPRLQQYFSTLPARTSTQNGRFVPALSQEKSSDWMLAAQQRCQDKHTSWKTFNIHSRSTVRFSSLNSWPIPTMGWISKTIINTQISRYNGSGVPGIFRQTQKRINGKFISHSFNVKNEDYVPDGKLNDCDFLWLLRSEITCQ